MNEFHYRVSWRAGGFRPGHHRSARTGGGLEFSGHSPLAEAGDARRLDLHASLRNPLGTWLVRRYRQRSSVPVFLVADLSMSFPEDKLGILADFLESAAYSTHRTGDRFGVIGCDGRLIPEFNLPPSFALGGAIALARKLRDFVPSGRGSGGLAEAAHHLGRQRALVFLVSDFHFSLRRIEQTLAAFSRHDVVPVVLWCGQEFERLPNFGLVHVRDPESGGARTLLMRPGLKARIRQNFERRRQELSTACMERNTRPLFLIDGFRADQVTEYFFSHAVS